MSSKQPLRIVVAALLLAAALACFAGVLDGAIEAVQRHPLGEPAEAHLDDALRQATVGFMTVSTIKAGLAVLEGSSFDASLGVGVSVQVGDVVQAIYDYVDVAWRTLFLAAVTLLGLKLVLAAAVDVAPFVLGIFFLVAALVLMTGTGERLRRSRAGGVDLLRTLPVVFVVLVYVLPISVLGASALSDRLTTVMLAEAGAELEAVETVLTPLSDPQGGWTERVREARDSIDRLVVQLRGRGESLFLATLRLIVGYLFDCVIFPLGLAWLGTRIARGGVGWALAESRWQRWATPPVDARPRPPESGT